MLEYKIEELKLKDLEEVIKVIEETFLKFEAPNYNKEGIDNFFKFANYQNIKEKLNENMKMYVAKVNGKIVGVIGYRDNSHINLLFVLEKYQYNGIAKALFNVVIENIKKLGIKKVTVNSSLYAYEVYKKLGFKGDNNLQEKDGIKFFMMYKEV